MQAYVLILPIISSSKRTLLVEKLKPEWQKNKLNLVGGKIEVGETPSQAAIRELKEESGITVKVVVECGEIVCKDSIIYCFYTDLGRGYFTLQPRKEEVEYVNFYDWDVIKNDTKLIPNLKVIIPLLRMRVVGWTIEDVDKSHEFGMKLDVLSEQL